MTHDTETPELPLKTGDLIYWRNSRGFRSHGRVYEIPDPGRVRVELDGRWYPFSSNTGGFSSNPRYTVRVDMIHLTGTHGFGYDARRHDNTEEDYPIDKPCHDRCSEKKDVP